ncbi:MAG: gamma-glutamylcyclotransferase [Mycobacteriales bacterium]
MPIYAAYGSNMDPAVMQERCPHSPVRGTAWLPGWRLTFGAEDFGWEGALPTLVEDPLSTVFVLLYDVPDHDAEALDGWEGADIGLYTKLRVRVSSLEGDEVVWTYVLLDYEGGLPSARTLGLIADAAEQAGAPSEYVAEIRSRPCRSNS